MMADETALTAWLHGEGFTIIEFDDGTDDWGYTDLARREVAIRRGLLSRQRLPALMHEALHVYHRHAGHQAACVEREINETVATCLIDPGEYAFWEAQFGWCTGGIAHAMDLPRWVVEAYRRALQRQTRVIY